MRPDTAEQLSRLAGEDRDGPLLGPLSLDDDALLNLARGVYMVMDPHGRWAYVGRVCSELDGNRLASRLRKEHRRETRKALAFDKVYFLRLKPDTPCLRVEELEGRISDHLQPYIGSRRPRPGVRARQMRRTRKG